MPLERFFKPMYFEAKENETTLVWFYTTRRNVLTYSSRGAPVSTKCAPGLASSTDTLHCTLETTAPCNRALGTRNDSDHGFLPSQRKAKTAMSTMFLTTKCDAIETLTVPILEEIGRISAIEQVPTLSRLPVVLLSIKP